MSIDVMARVWNQSAAKESSLLVLLALADRADENGVCWPGVEWISQKARLKDERHVRRILRQLEDMGEIYVSLGAGRGRTSLYLICTGLSEDDIAKVLIRRFEMSVPDAVATAKSILEKGGLHAQKGVHKPPFETEEKGGYTREKGGHTREKGAATPPDPSDTSDTSINTRAATPPALPANDQPAPAPTPAPAAVPAHDDYGTVRTLYENEFGLLTPIISAAIKDQLRACPAGWIPKAIEIAVKRGNRKWSYVEGILRRWHADGFDGDQDNYAAAKPKGQGSKSAGYGRRAAAPKEKTNEYENDPEYLDFLASFVDARDGSRLAAD
jgi:DnaD/phage-associated family protein